MSSIQITLPPLTVNQPFLANQSWELETAVVQINMYTSFDE